MKMMKNLLWGLVLLQLVLLGGIQGKKEEEEGKETLENVFASRSISLVSQLVKELSTIEVKNVGSSPVSSYLLPLELFSHLAHFTAKAKKADRNLPFKFVPFREGNAVKIELPRALKEGETATIVTTQVYTHVLEPSPKSVPQLAKQGMKISGNMLLYSPYPTLKSKTTYVLPSEEAEFTGEGLVQGGDRLTYGPSTERVEPFSRKNMEARFTHNGRFLLTKRLLRTIELSFWGNNAAFEEHYDTIHDGAELKGFYSRLDYDRSTHKHHETGVINSWDIELPVGATDVYYRDIIGNISTSRFRDSPFEPQLTLIPRFPLFGGWKLQWYHGYNVPLSNILKKSSSGRYFITFDFVSPYDDAVIDDFTLLVTLPEGATNIEFISDVDLGVETSFETKKTYLDTFGRPVLVVKKKNVVDEHAYSVQVAFDFPTVAMLHEPFVLFVFLLSLFAVSMIFSRLDFSISKSPQEQKKEQARELFLDLVEKVEAQKDLIKKVEDAGAAFKKNKDKDEGKKKRDALESEWKEQLSSFQSLHDQIKRLVPSSNSKLEELKKVCADRWARNITAFQEILSGKERKSKEDEEISKAEESKIEDIFSSFD